MFDKFQNVLSDEPGHTKTVSLRLYISTENPICLPPFRISGKCLESEEEILILQKLGIIEPSTSVWCAPVVPILKPSGASRICMDYRRLNQITCQEHYYMPVLSDIMARVGMCTILSKMYLAQGFHQIAVEPGPRDKTTYVCPFGRFRYVRMPLGLKMPKPFLRE